MRPLFGVCTSPIPLPKRPLVGRLDIRSNTHQQCPFAALIRVLMGNPDPACDAPRPKRTTLEMRHAETGVMAEPIRDGGIGGYMDTRRLQVDTGYVHP